MSAPEAFEPPIVDAHAHVFLRDLPVARAAWTRPDYDYTAEDYLAELDRYGVHFGVLAAVSIYGTYNDYVLAALRRHRRLRATINLDPADADPHALARMRDEGVVGVRLQLARRAAMPDFDDDAHRLMFRRIRDLDWHVHLAVEDHWLPGVLEQLEPTGVRIVVDHFGHPDPVTALESPGFQALLRSIDRGRTWVKLSAAYRLTWTPTRGSSPDPRAMELAVQTARRLLEVAGPQRLVWGSDAPFVAYENCTTFQSTLEALQEWVPSRDARRRMSETALKLYFS